jgi:hypothetical protein
VGVENSPVAPQPPPYSVTAPRDYYRPGPLSYGILHCAGLSLWLSINIFVRCCRGLGAMFGNHKKRVLALHSDDVPAEMHKPRGQTGLCVYTTSCRLVVVHLTHA